MATKQHTAGRELTEVPRYIYFAGVAHAGEFVAAGEKKILAHGKDADAVEREADATGLPYMMLAIKFTPPSVTAYSK